mgnify:CR=1 FL=1
MIHLAEIDANMHVIEVITTVFPVVAKHLLETSEHVCGGDINPLIDYFPALSEKSFFALTIQSLGDQCHFIEVGLASEQHGATQARPGLRQRQARVSRSCGPGKTR